MTDPDPNPFDDVTTEKFQELADQTETDWDAFQRSDFGKGFMEMFSAGIRGELDGDPRGPMDEGLGPDDDCPHCADGTCTSLENEEDEPALLPGDFDIEQMRRTILQRGERIKADQRIIADQRVKLHEIEVILWDYEEGHGPESVGELIADIRHAMTTTIRWVGDDLTD